MGLGTARLLSTGSESLQASELLISISISTLSIEISRNDLSTQSFFFGTSSQEQKIVEFQDEPSGVFNRLDFVAARRKDSFMFS